MIFNVLVLFLFILTKSCCDDVVSAEGHSNAPLERTDTANVEESHRRFIQDTDDKEWHVSHLKATDFSRRSECAGDTFEDQIKKYRRVLQNDASRVEYVFAEGLPFSESDLEETNKCKARNTSDIFMHKTNNNTDILAKNTTKKHNHNNTKEDNDRVPEQVNTGTTVNFETKESKGSKHRNATSKGKSRRVSEYQFSSVEYYDEVSDFDETVCPDAVEVITLEIDQLRIYDIECETILEWRSLD